MPVKRDKDATTGSKLLKLFQILMLDGGRHFQGDLAERLNCSKQTVMRLMIEIEGVLGASLKTGLERHRRWYQLCTRSRPHLGLELEELRYLRICRDLADPYLPRQVAQRIDASIFRFSLLMAEASSTEKVRLQKSQFAFFSKGHIDYSAHYEHLDLLLRAQEEKRICLVSYKALGQKTAKIHRFAPGRMVSMNNAIYVLGADVAADLKTLRHLTNLAVHRISGVSITDETASFAIPEADPGTFGLPWHEPRTFRIHFKPGKAADYVRERIWADEQVLTELPDGGLELQITTRSQPELAAWVRSFGDEARFVEGGNSQNE